MFEARVLYMLRKYLGEYIEGLSAEALRISVWKGDVVLKDLRLKAEALNSLNLPVTVKAGFIGTITLQFPWKSLGKESVIVLIDRIFVLAEPAPDGHTLKDEDREKLFESKLKQIEAAESTTIDAAIRKDKAGAGLVDVWEARQMEIGGCEGVVDANTGGGMPSTEKAESTTIDAAIRKDKAGAAPSESSWWGSLIATIIGNLKVTISNVHIRYEDSISNPGHPFCSGITLLKLAAVTTDEQGNETFDASGALDNLRKSLQLLRLAVYHDSESAPWKLGKRWEDLNSVDWSEIFQDGIDELDGNRSASLWAKDRRYLVSPINGVLKYHRLGKQERQNPQIPFEKASLVLSDVYFTVSEAQYYDGIKLLEALSTYKTRVEFSHLRPVVPVLEDTHAWWRYAMIASLQQKKLCYWFSWERIKHLCQLRRLYVQIYSTFLQQTSNVDIYAMRKIERILDSKVVLLWRLLAHAKLELVKSKQASQPKGAMKRSWWSFGWSTSSGQSSAESISSESQFVEDEKLIKQEWQAINELLSYQPDEDISSPRGMDIQNMIRVQVDVSIGKAAARIVSISQTEIVYGSFELLNLTTKMFHKSVHCDVSLKCYGLSSPEGQLSQSVSSERKRNALEASFVHAPVGEDIDWRLSATIAPCHVTILMESYERFMKFITRSNAVSPTVTMETATALQMKIERVTRKAQEQLQMVLEEKCRFSLDVDFDAPKVRIPMRSYQSSSWSSQFLLDFGHFTLHTREGQHDEQKQSLYTRFYISGRDMSAIFIDGDYSGKSMVSDALESHVSMENIENGSQLYSLLDRCGMSVIVDQIKIPHPRYPSTRISVQVPNLGVHFSPERYSRILRLLDIFYGSTETIDENCSDGLQTGHFPWLPPDLATEARILVWKGFGHSLAEWKPCYIVLSGLYLYVLETEFSQTYQRYCSVSGRQVLEVSPSSIGGLTFVVAVSSRGVDVQKALESVNTLIIEFRDSDEKNSWYKELVQATYRASAPPAMNILGDQITNLSESVTPRHGSTGQADLVISGTLVEIKLSIYGQYDGNCGTSKEDLILEVLGSGGKVNLFSSSSNLTVKTKLHALKIIDELQGRFSTGPQYLARSVLKEHNVPMEDSAMHTFFLEEDDFFTDALPDFMSTPDQIFHNFLCTPDSFNQCSGNDFENCLNHGHAKEQGGEVFYEAWDNNISDFVVVTFVSRSPDSPLYDGIDTQMSIRMSALEFFCNRPTLVALIGFGFDLSLVNSAATINEINTNGDVDMQKKDEYGRALVKGLLGYGKGRVVFNLIMDVDSVCVLLNKEDGSQLAMFVQESFILNLKFHPCSTTIEGTLGNMRLCDMSLGPDDRWGWLCDIRNQGIESLIWFKFQSYSVEDDDYDGYDYSLSGRLSAVRIVFVYRFVLEITSYFMGLASPHSEEVIKLVDKVGGIEWLIQKYEMDGDVSLKLDLSLDTPIIIVPKNSMSEDYIQLDLGQLQVKNNFFWFGNKDNDPSAVHLDILDAEIQGVNMAVGVNGRLGKSMIREGQGLHIQVRRSLRDVFRKVPTLSIDVQVGLLHCVMSDKEYDVIVNCLNMNLSETPNLPPSFRNNVAGAKDSMRMLVDKVNLNGQNLPSLSIFVVTVEVHYALLELYNGLDEESPLAQISLEGLWVSYRSTSFFEMDLYVTIPKFSVLDIRPDTKPEMRLMLGSYTDVSKPVCNNLSSSSNLLTSQVNGPSKLENVTDMDGSNLTMLILDYRWRSSFCSFVIRIQKPRVLVVLDFLLEVAEFFVPSLGTITGREDTLHPNKDILTSADDIILSEPVFMQHDDVVHLSPRRQLIVDGCQFDEFIYDGCGHILSLTDEFETKGQPYSGTIIILGRGKKLRFKNVKIENGALLKKCTYLSNDSSYSIAEDDGVEISLPDKDPPVVNRDGSIPYQDSIRDTNTFDVDSTSLAIKSQNFTFEAQVVSPEFTFYDSSKLALDNPLHLEKLLRARMDLRFMYASKENDTWARVLVKDFTIEAGSGLVILEPMDVSGGYTSVKDKTSISLLSSDVCIHLSLSVASLLLKLQNQAFEALQFGKVNPLVSCTNFKRIWVSPKGDFPGYNLTFWRPQAPSNYAILGDCVTSRPVPPTQVVVAVSNAYGRVRKPLGFKCVGLFSNFREVNVGSQSDNSADCSIWLPIPPPGYTAVGCVAHVGSQPPSNHVIHCLRSDLVTSASYSDCIFYAPPQPRAISGFSIWHVDNVLGSFYAHSSVECPPKIESVDLHQVLLRNPNWHLSVRKTSPPSVGYDQQSQQKSNYGNASSGWDILRTLSGASYFISTPHFERIWLDKGSDFRRPISIWRPISRPGFAALGDCITEGFEPPALGLVFKCDNTMISSKPHQFTKVAHAVGKGLEDAFFWYPIPPPGYASLGCVVTRKDEAPPKELFCCPRIDLINQANVFEEPISRSFSFKGTNCWSIWKVENQAYTFLARSDLKKPSSRLAYTISDCVKPKTRENISAEMKLGCFSLTVLDSFLGTITPVIDVTITNINLATHGSIEAVNAVLICSMAASTFNRQLESWEPLVEPFDGIFKLETFDTNDHPPSKVGKRIRVAATSSLNLNVSAANLQSLTDTIISWERQSNLSQSLSKKTEEAGETSKNPHLSFSALDEDDLQKVVLQNKLGCDIYLRKITEISEDIELLQNKNHTSLLMPPPRFSDRLNVIAKSRETRYYVTIQIFESKGFPILDDGNKKDYFCALRLLIDSKVSDQYKLFPQSARTRCVRPWVSKINGIAVGYAKWNEVFIFEVPEKGLANLEVEVTNLAAKAGKGEVIGALSVPLGRSGSTLKRATSIRMLQQAVGSDAQNISSYALKKKVHDHEENNDCGLLVISTTYFERNIDFNSHRGIENETAADRDVGFWVGFGPKGPWESFSLILPLSVVPKSLDRNPFAFEVLMRNGRKHAILRSLAVIKNETDIKVEICLCPSSMLSRPLLNMSAQSPAVVSEEVFENQRYQPISGWGNISSFHGDPGHWSTRNFSHSSKEFFEPPLPSGWHWISAWRIDKSGFVDSDGWAYGTDFQNLKWPPSSSKSTSKSGLHFVRRRRWVRNRQQKPEQNIDDMRNIIAVIDPASSTVMPWTSMARDSDLVLQVRPYVENSQELYAWSKIVALGLSKDQSANQLASVTGQNTMRQPNSQNSCLRLNNLEKNDVLLCCNPCISNKQNTWLSVGTDASVLHTELNAPVYDWKISINSVLRLENKLPHEAEYAIWEKTVQGNLIERQHGIVSSNGGAFISSADIHRPIYLTLFVQGGWILEKEVVLIMDLLNLDHASSFWIIHQQSKRRVRVSVEYDMGGTDAAPKSVRLFVPYWIRNDTSLSLSYRIVEIDPLDNLDADSMPVSRGVKSAKFALKHSSKSIDKRFSSSRRNSDILEVIDDFSPNCVMLSTQDYTGHGGASSFSSRSDGLPSKRIGISVAIHNSEHYSPGISLIDLERMERVDVNAFSFDGSYFKLSPQLKMSSDRTKVISFLPHTLFINRVGRTVYLSQCDTKIVEFLRPTDPPKMLKWQSISGNELLKLSLDGSKWSSPFSIGSSGMMHIHIKNDIGDDQTYLRVEVRGGMKSSRYEIVFRRASFSSPYRIENRSLFLSIRFRQVDNSDGFWYCLPPNSAASFSWEDLGRRHLLEVLVDGSGLVESQEYNIDEVKDHQPLETSIGPTRALRITVIKEGKLQITRISDWMPENDTSIITLGRVQLPVFDPSENDYKQSSSELNSEFHITFELSELGLSITDHMPEEILYLSIQNLLFSYSCGLDSGVSRLKLRMNAIQVDNQLPFTPMPVLFGPQKVGDQLDYVLKFSLTMQTNSTLDFCEYPYLGFQVPDNSTFLVNIHEPIIWRLHELLQKVKLGRLFGSADTAISVDPIIKIGLLNTSEIRFKVSMAMSPSQRPRGVLGFWSSLMTALGNTEHMQIRVGQRYREEICMRQSALISTAISNIQKDLLSHPLQLLSGVDILGNASSALSNMSKGVAALSMDKKFIQSRQKQDSKTIEDFGDVIREGGGAFAKGLFRGVTGILTKPLEGAKSSGVEGFVQGVGKGIIGAAAQPVSGVLDLLSKTTEGANAVRMRIASAITSEEQLLRRRLPRVIGGDNLLRPYDAYKATGQVILQLAESGSFFGQVDLFRVRGKFAFSDAYEDHFLLPKGKILLVTHRRVLLLQQPTNIMAQRKFNPARDPCSVMWDVLWEDLITMELTNGKKDNLGSPFSRLILYMRVKSPESKENIRVIKCMRGSPQADQIYSSIHEASLAYGPNASKDNKKRKVPRPYTPSSIATLSDVLPTEVYGSWDVRDAQESPQLSSSFGAVVSQSQPAK